MLKLLGRGLGSSLLEALVEPLHSLLDLISSKKLKAEQVPVAAMATAAHDYVHWSNPPSLIDIGDLAASMSAIMVLKSRELTPWLDEAEPEPALKPFRNLSAIGLLEPAVLLMDRRLASGFETVPRCNFVEGAERHEVSLPVSSFLLSQTLISQLNAATVRGRTRVPPPLFLRVEMAIRTLRESLSHLRTFTFHGLVRDRSLDRRGTVVYFLAVLDLARRGLVTVRQDGPFEDILLSTGARPRTVSDIAG